MQQAIDYAPPVRRVRACPPDTTRPVKSEDSSTASATMAASR